MKRFRTQALAALTAVILLAGSVACSTSTSTASYETIPLPQSIVYAEGQGFLLQDGMVVTYPESVASMPENAQFLADYLRHEAGIDLKLQPFAEGVAAPAGIQLVIDPTVGAGQAVPEEAYRLTVSTDGIVIAAPTPAGVFYGIQTLRKSVPVGKYGSVQLAEVVIEDSPRFAWRGAMLDVSRHFFTVDEVKTFIDMLALHHINRFHWHLSDDQGWRLPIQAYPELTEIGSRRDGTVIGHNTSEYDGIPYGGAYTRDEILEIVAYAAQQHITVIPEVDMPGHMLAALTTYPELGCTGGPYEVWQQWGVSDDVLCAGDPKTLEFVKNVLKEVMEMFPSEYIHVGGDECPKARWEACATCQAKIAELGLKDDAKNSAEMKLQSWFMTQIGNFLAEHGRKMIGWDEILEGGLAPGATVMSWRGIGGAIEAAHLDHDAILSPHTHLYFDYYQTNNREDEPIAIGGFTPIDRVYSFEPPFGSIPADKHHHILGIQANLWTEYIADFKQVQYMEFPRMAALCEIQWTEKAQRNYEDFLKRLPAMIDRYRMLDYNFATHLFDVEASIRPDSEQNVVLVELKTLDDAPIYYTTDGTDPRKKGSLYNGPVAVKEDGRFQAVVKRGQDYSRVFSEQIKFNLATTRPITLAHPTHRGYTFSGPGVLVDGLKGNGNYKTGRWLGFYQGDMDALIDLQSVQTVEQVKFSTCVEKGDWICDTREVVIEVSLDNEHFTQVIHETYPSMTLEDRNGIYDHLYAFPKVEARYVRVKAVVENSLPEWHNGRGLPAFLFVDEIEVR
ncbi:MAG: family 20 glycosylhydrolase [Bacteroidales bacterium]|nr:family 20 glycosylhydrolase [Bacteroidales bacterium]